MTNFQAIMDRCIDTEAEKAVIGCLLIGKPFHQHMSITDAIIDDPKWFTDRACQELYGILRSEYKAGNALDPCLVTLVGILRDRGKLAAVGGRDELVAMASGVPTSINLPKYANRVRDLYYRREILRAFEGGLRQLSEPLENGFFEEADLWLTRIDKCIKRSSSSNTVHVSVVEPKTENAERKLCKTRITWIDEQVGLALGEVVFIAARPSMGKSSLGNQISTECARNGHPALVFSQEMSPESWVTNTKARLAKVDATKIRKKQLTPDEIDQLKEAGSELRTIPLHIHEKSVRSVKTIATEVTRLHESKGIQVVVVDYIQIVRSGKKHNSVNDELTEVSQTLKALARDLDICVIVISQLNRDGVEKGAKTLPPSLSQLRGSGSLEQDADVALFVHRPEHYCHGKGCPPEYLGRAQILCEKNRNGPTGHCWFHWIPQHFEFKELTYSDWPGRKKKDEESKEETPATMWD